MDAVALVNGVAYSFVDIVVSILDVPIAGISAINYEEEQEKTNNFGTSKLPVSRGKAGINTTGSMEISMNDVEAIRDIAPQRGSLLSIPAFNIIVTFINEQVVQRHRLLNCEFTNDGVDSSLGDTDLRKTYNLVISHIKYR